MNKSDSERISSVLENIDYQPASNENEADLIIVNMCSVRQSAVDRVYGKLNQISKIKNQNDKSKCKIILTGCILNEDKKRLKNKVDLILNIKDLPNWPKYLKFKTTVRSRRSPLFNGSSFYLKVKPKYSNNFSAFVPIMTGCNNFCSYCVVPFTRGPEVSRPVEEIMQEVKKLAKNGAKEIWLLGQNVNDYVSRSSNERIKTNKKRIFVNNSLTFVSNSGDTVNFAKLLKMVNDIEGNFWIRFTSPHPKNFSDELIETMAKCQKITPYLNLPVQSGDDEILKRMNRPYTIAKYKKLIEKIRSKFAKIREGLERDIAISTDVIVGFPGETKKQFQNTVKLFKEIKFAMAYIAQYSPRPGTAAEKMKDNVPKKEKERRWKILTEILKKTALEKNKKFVGKEIEVLVERQETSNKKQVYFGKTRHYKTVKIQLGSRPYTLNANLIGQFVKVKILDALPWGLKGKLI